METTYYHHYRMVHNIDSKEVIPGIELVFIELQKFKALKFSDRRLKFLTMIDESTTEVPEELGADSDIREALDQLHYSSFTEQELNYYEKYWDAIRIEKSSIADAIEKAEESVKNAEVKVTEANQKTSEALALAEKERAEKEKNRLALVNLVKRLKSKSFSEEDIAEDTGLSLDEIRIILS